ncbi:taste receptor cell protein 1-like isoform X1 [Cricetulus griseus]|uniref:taste receptor cell protein 1-like isoform X1 n=1 Tax=Cricetulus griseus TaxID=10029 RepID=UPI00022F6500|nr:taste receptor cell protein 1-like isoform X1 [Cricetulus griseus]
MDKQWFSAAGILLAAFLIVSASTLTLLSTHEDINQVPSAPDTSAQQGSGILGILTETIGGINSVERESEALEKRAGALSTEALGGQESPSMPGPLGSTKPSGRVKPGPIPPALNTSAAHMTVASQPGSSGADPGEENVASGTLETIAMSLPQTSPTRGSEQFSKVPKLCWTVPATASSETTVAPKPTWHPIRASLFPIFPRAPCPLLSTSSSPAWRDGHSRSEASPPVTLAPRSPLGLPILPWMPNTLKATELPLPASSRRSGLELTSQAFTVGSGSSENPIALGTGPVSSGAPGPLLSSATSPSHPSSPYSPPSSPELPLSSSPPPASLSFFPPPSSIPASVSFVTTGARDPPKPSVSVTAPSTTDSSIKTSNLAPPMALRPSHPGPWDPTSLIHLPTFSLQHFSILPSAPHSSGFTKLSGVADPTQSSTLLHPGQDVSLQDLSPSTPGPSHVAHSVTFRINSKCFTTAVGNLIPLKRRLLKRLICYQLQLIYLEAFSSFKNVSALLFRPDSTEVKASLVFGQPDPSALEILWALYRKVKASRWLLGHLSLADNSITSDEYNIADLTRETISITFILMRPFLPQLLLPGSQPFILLEKQILQLVTHEVSRFYKANPHDQPLLLFSNVNEWVSIYMEYKFKSPIPTHLRGLASYLAHHITDPTLQKSSMVANGEKAELALYETQLLILGHPFGKALENKTSSESQELRGLLTKWLTSVLKPLHNFGQVVVEEFQQEPLTAKVQAAFFGAAPAQAIIQDCMHRALGFLQETEGLQLEMLIPVLGMPSSRASRGPSHGFMLNLQLTSLHVLLEQYAFHPRFGFDPMTAPPQFRLEDKNLHHSSGYTTQVLAGTIHVALGAALHFTKKQTPYLS